MEAVVEMHNTSLAAFRTDMEAQAVQGLQLRDEALEVARHEMQAERYRALMKSSSPSPSCDPRAHQPWAPYDPRAHQPWARCDPHAHQRWAPRGHCLAGTCWLASGRRCGGSLSRTRSR